MSCIRYRAGKRGQLPQPGLFLCVSNSRPQHTHTYMRCWGWGGGGFHQPRCVLAMVKNELPGTSSHKSKPVSFLFVYLAFVSAPPVVRTGSGRGGHLPILSGVGQVVLDDGPHDTAGRILVAVGNQPLGVADEGNGPERRTIALWPAPVARESGEVDIEFGLAETGAVGEVTRGV